MKQDSIDYKSFTPKHRPRFVTATSLFDGHDASINIMRRLMQYRGAEVIHLGHNRSVRDIVKAAVEEDAHAIAVSSYQGGHLEFFRYMREELNRLGAEDIKIFGGGGGVITPQEIETLMKAGITKIYSPEDGQRLSLPGIIGHMLASADYPINGVGKRSKEFSGQLGRAITLLEEARIDLAHALSLSGVERKAAKTLVLGVTGTGGAGKSSLTDELLGRILLDSQKSRVAVICVDPTKRKTGGALLGDRIRFNSCSNDRVFLRSLATRGSEHEISGTTGQVVELVRQLDFDLVILETSGIGQGNAKILELADVSLYVMTAEYGASTQLEKIDMLDYADVIAINKFERAQSLDALRDVQTQLRRSRFGGVPQPAEGYPVFGTIASRFNDDGVNGLYRALAQKINGLAKTEILKVNPTRSFAQASTRRDSLIPQERARYLSEVARTVRRYHATVDASCDSVRNYESLVNASRWFNQRSDRSAAEKLDEEASRIFDEIPSNIRRQLQEWPEKRRQYLAEHFRYEVRGRPIDVSASFKTLSQTVLPKVALPDFQSQSEIARFLMKENVPGEFPYTGGIYPFRRTTEDPKRQFAGEGGPVRTNQRFHYLAKDDDAKRLSTAFDSVTLYGADPHARPDIYGKVGESGVSIATLADMRDLFSGFDLCHPQTSVSMTINGPAPIILAMFLNAAIDQETERFVKEQKRQPNADERQSIIDKTLKTVRGTVQADILKEDQAQNTCIFSTEFALRMMADVQAFFIEKQVRNYYSVSISGYHIAEAGANPVSQLAFTLANGFTYVEYYLRRGMKINDFAPNLSFFFSNGVDAEYAVLGRVARRIWAIAMRDIYGASERSQKLKYHIQTSGRSLHAQEMAFNDIRTTLQALLALYDNCNSLHTNAYDEAVTTPTEESVRRAMAIQMIINREFGPNQCENINQGSYFIEYLTDLVEEAVLQEFERISHRGGVLGAMETQYQRNKIQEESLYYEGLKDSGALPIIGVNTYINPKQDEDLRVRSELNLARATYPEKDDQIVRLEKFNKKHASERSEALSRLEKSVLEDKNIFAELMHTVRFASLGEITETLYRVGGQYRRSM